jgi:flavin reductase (DIM6/NTAB) family NADH-FMN oxidoreductase RutF
MPLPISSESGVDDNSSQPLVERRALRTALGRFPTGVTVVATRSADGQVHCMTVNSFASLSLEPPLILWALRARSVRFETFVKCPVFSVNVLSESQVDVARRYATPTDHAVNSRDWKHFLSDCPVVQGAVAQFVCRTDNHVRQGDHAIQIGEVVDFATSDSRPLLFMAGGYFAGSRQAPL